MNTAIVFKVLRFDNDLLSSSGNEDNHAISYWEDVIMRPPSTWGPLGAFKSKKQADAYMRNFSKGFKLALYSCEAIVSSDDQFWCFATYSSNSHPLFRQFDVSLAPPGTIPCEALKLVELIKITTT